jgi:hypothetical protein
MSWGLIAVGGATLVGSILGSKASKGAAESQSGSAQQGMESQERMFNQQLEMMQPYRDAGTGALGQLQGLASPQGRADALSGYYAGDEYKMLSNQMTGDITSNLQAQAAATGGLRGGNYQQLSSQAIGNIAPQLGQNYLSNMYNQQTGLANMGMGAASQGAQQAGQLGQGLAAGFNQMGQAQAQNQLTQGNITGNAIGTLGGLGYNYFGGSKF